MGKAPKEEAPRPAARSRASAIRERDFGVSVRPFLFDDRDTDLPLPSIAPLVAKIKNASRKAKPFRALMERPDAVRFGSRATNPVVGAFPNS
jgi:hypothetical protein